MKYIEFTDLVNKEKHIIPADKIVVTETKVHSITNNMIWLISKDEYIKIKNQLIYKDNKQSNTLKPFIPFKESDYVTTRTKPNSPKESFFKVLEITNHKCKVRKVFSGDIFIFKVNDLTKVEQKKKESDYVNTLKPFIPFKESDYVVNRQHGATSLYKVISDIYQCTEMIYIESVITGKKVRVPINHYTKSEVFEKTDRVVYKDQPDTIYVVDSIDLTKGKMNIFTFQYPHYKHTDVHMNLFEKLLTRVEFKSDNNR